MSYSIFILFSVAVSGQIKIRPDSRHAPTSYEADVSITLVKFENYIPPNSPAKPAGDVYTIDSNNTAFSNYFNSQNPPNNLKCTITVHNENSSAADETVLVVVLPADVVILSLPANATQHKSGSNPAFPGYMTFNLGQIRAGQSIAVNFAFIRLNNSSRLSAYTYSVTPDLNPANNFKDASF